MKLHLEKHESSIVKKDPRIHSCHQCSSDQKYNMSGLRRHLKSKHSATYKCKEYGCQKSFFQEKRYNAHMRNHKNSKCHLCSYESSSLNNGPQNIRIHLLGVHKLTIEDLISIGRYDPKNFRKRKEGESWLNRYYFIIFTIYHLSQYGICYTYFRCNFFMFLASVKHK